MLFFKLLSTSVVLPLALAANVDWTKLQTKQGDKLPDFSFCGYHASNDPLPAANRAATSSLSAGSGDQTKRIQDALDKISSSGGGVLHLKAGEYQLASGVVVPPKTSLRGDGPGKTKIQLKDGTKVAFTMGTKVKGPKVETPVDITDKYVPVGSNKVTVKSASGLKAGQSVFIQRAVTQKWVNANGMGNLGKDKHWLTPKDTVFQPRKIQAISANTVTLDVPLTDQMDSNYMSPKLAPYTPPAASSEMGLEALSITLSPSCSGHPISKEGDPKCNGGAALAVLAWATNIYARDVAIRGYNNAINIAQNASLITLQGLTITRDGKTDGSHGYAADIGISGTQVLVIDSSTHVTDEKVDMRAFPVVTQGLTAGPNCVVRYSAPQPKMQIQPHAHWAHGFLVDNSSTPTTFINRAGAGSGHGWAINSGVAWNINDDYEIQSPPLGTNWGIGCHGGARGKGNNGTMVAEKEAVTPASLFDAQLAARKK
ncbi:hemagglutinin-related protein [Apiospora arundinis]|uniref:Hemagglutinin-related protein n=1 Tax=Apiospora arundinis TaxID=335852 RepID=A0ABR2JGF0_9PEZI